MPVPTRRTARGARRPRSSLWRTLAIPLAYLVIAGFGIWWIDVRPSAVLAGLDDIASLLGRMLPPAIPEPANLFALILQTLWIAIAGTGFAAIVSVFLAAAASRHYAGPRVVGLLARGIIIVLRAIPSLVFALIFVRIFGLGPFAGALAIGCHSIGMIAKMMADTFDELSPTAREAVSAAGAGRAQTFVATTLSRSMPDIVSLVLYRLDINIRASAVLGIVGAGGIGVALQQAIGSLSYRTAAGIIVVIVLLLLVLEGLSYLAQRALTQHAAERTVAQLYGAGPDTARPGWNRPRVSRALAVWIPLGLFAVAVSQLSLNTSRLGQAWSQARDILAGFLPPHFSVEILMGIFETVVMAMTATAFGVVFGLVIAVLSTPYLVRFEPLNLLLRGLVVLLRGVPDIIWALLFVAALGLGPFAGFLALTISCTALASKFFTDGLLKIDPLPVRALEATGAGRLQVFVSGVWPQFVPSFISNTLFTSDLALRESAVLGIVGAGGIGFLLQESIVSLDYQTTAGILIGLVVVVVALETVAQQARRKVL
ncbi:phosphonate ABC transporter, permease protein PhnE [Leucobacter allii]|uniref:Phosphonate ABC transporter, permease protein PhnE n=1 Tax=Leucobacter allii TaxID=2932247 RepID=A0ABY4FML4_9MICO|nr:phosphonate ABC transporter, permease protein PhnE [Leucobacter allii]UOQ57465.1 phosphonate ABC transporter, permease protein PhnE [Leucobacter allii]